MTYELKAALVGAIVGAVISGFFGLLVPYIQSVRGKKEKEAFYLCAY